MGFLKRDDASSCSDESNGEIFKSIPKNSTTFCIWRIEGLRAISLGRTKIGTFLSNSAYLIYAVSAKDGPLPYPGIPAKVLKESASVRAIHFWVGSNCDSSVSGAAALRAAELDSQISATILMREAQGHESSRFLAYFRTRQLIVENSRDNSILDVSNGNNNNDTTCRLHRVTGVVMPILTELDAVDWCNFSSRDVLLLDVRSRSTIFLWLGSNSDPLHRVHAAKLLEDHKNTNNNEVRIFIVEDGYEQSLHPDVRELFDRILDPKKRRVSPEALVTDFPPGPAKLYKCNEQTGKYKVAELKSGPIFRSDLESASVFLLDRAGAGIWAWVGKDASPKERLEAVRNARGFVKKKGYSPDVLVARALENHEPKELRSILRGWGEPAIRPLMLPANFEPEYMSERPRTAAECQLVDDGSGSRILWTVTKDRGLEEVVENKEIFYAEACYVMKYKYGYGRKEKSIIYYWEGVHSSSIDREIALDAACSFAEEESSQFVKASQGKEPPHLLQIYGGKLTILAGQHRANPPCKYLVRVFGSTQYTSKAVERPARATSLDSGGVFILFSGSPMVWCGSRSTGDAREASRRLAPSTAPLICEGREDDEFWAQIEGKGGCNNEYHDVDEQLEKHLYHFSVRNNSFVGKEVLGFTQSSLLPETIWLLDAGNVIWIWVGNYSTPKSIRDCLEDAKTYLITHPASRDRNTSISVIKQGLEPSTFIGLFDNWNQNLLRDYRPFSLLRLSLQEDETITNNITSIKLSSEFDSYVKYPLTTLKTDSEKLPSGVNVSRKEMHLTYDDFVSVFKMEPTDFEKLPSWRRQRLKQTAGLF